MEKFFLSALLPLVLFSCVDKNRQAFDECSSHLSSRQSAMEHTVSEFFKNPTRENYERTIEALEALKSSLQRMGEEVDRSKLEPVQQSQYNRLTQSVSESVASAERGMNSTMSQSWRIVVDEADCLKEKGVERYPFYLYKGDAVDVQASSNMPMASVVFLNQETGEILAMEASAYECRKQVTVSHPGIYMLEITLKSKQYLSANVKRRAASAANFYASTAVLADTLHCSSTDKGAFSVKELEFTNIYEEPVKCTLASQGRALFGNSFRSIVSVQLPPGTTDWFYQLRLSTSKGDSSDDGMFCGELISVYSSKSIGERKIYASTKSIKTGVFDDLLSLVSSPKREEEAYCNFFVIKDANEARKFQDGTGNVLYNIDYSIKGLQSANGHIPAMGRNSFYIGLENPRFTTSIYVWLEISSVKTVTNWYKVVYKKMQP